MPSARTPATLAGRARVERHVDGTRVELDLPSAMARHRDAVANVELLARGNVEGGGAARTMRSLVSALYGTRPAVHGRDPGQLSAVFLDADQVARRVAEGAIAYAVRLLDRLLGDLGSAGLQKVPSRSVVVSRSSRRCPSPSSRR